MASSTDGNLARCSTNISLHETCVSIVKDVLLFLGISSSLEAGCTCFAFFLQSFVERKIENNFLSERNKQIA